jgi:hypothetical protein
MTSQPQLHFVISAPRSGSTWLTLALNHHPEIFATEQRLFGDFAEIWRNNDGSSTPRLTFDSYARAFAVHYCYEELGLEREQFIQVLQKSFINFLIRFATRRKNASVVIDKITPYPGTAAKVVNQIRALCPDAKIIQLIRDGRDVVTSGTFDWLLKDAQGTDRYAYFVKKRSDARLSRFFDDAVMRKWSANWRETVEIFDSRPADLVVRYEDMKCAMANQLTRIYELLGIDASLEIAVAAAEATEFEKVAGRQAGDDNQPTAKARKGIAGDWRNYFTQRDARLFHEMAGAQLIQLGYAADSSWADKCPQELELGGG